MQVCLVDRTTVTFITLSLLVSILLVIADASAALYSSADVDILYDGFEPPVNPFLADSPWAQTQRNPYQQGSSNWAGPTADDELEVDFVKSAPVSITAVYSNLDDNGHRAIWENNAFLTGKLTTNVATDDDKKSFQVIDRIHHPLTQDAFSGAYYLIDKDDVFFAGREQSIRSFINAIPGDALSGVVMLDSFQLPLLSDQDSVRGLNLLYDGVLVFTTSLGIVGVIRRDFTGLQVLQLGSDNEPEIISNSHAVDEDGGIYVVTSKKMHRVQWNGSTLAIQWSADYEVGPDDPVAGRVGAGSGSTPTVMGTGQQDKFIVITDGQELMHLVLFWKDEIPDDWEPIAPDKDRRIAAEVPVTFGDAGATTSQSEQSVLVRGYGAVVVNNDYGLTLPSWLPDVLSQLFILLTGKKKFAPYGVEKLEWNPTTRTLDSVWANAEISCPNGIPTMSAVTNLVYCVGQRNAVWTMEAVDWNSGDSIFYKKLGKSILAYNSAYAALVVGANRELVSGSFAGVFRVRRKD
jgi:hypothetical protein